MTSPGRRRKESRSGRLGHPAQRGAWRQDGRRGSREPHREQVHKVSRVPEKHGRGPCGTCGERRASQGIRSARPHQRPLFKALALLQAPGGLPLGSGRVARVLMSLGLCLGPTRLLQLLHLQRGRQGWLSQEGGWKGGIWWLEGEKQKCLERGGPGRLARAPGAS